MNDSPMQHADIRPTPINLMHGGDQHGGLEPIAVPMGRLVSILRRHAWVIVVVLATGIGLTAYAIAQLPSLYTADASILIEPQRTQVSDLQAISPDSGDVGGLLRTQIDILRSPELTLGVVQALHLENDPEFRPHGDGLKARAIGLLDLIGIRPAPKAESATPEQVQQTAAAILSGKTGFTNELRSSVLTVSVTTQSPQLSAAIANEVVKQFLQFKRQEKFAAMQRAHDWFQEQMGKLSKEVLAADLAVEQYRQLHGLQEQAPDSGDTTKSDTVNRQQLNSISSQLTSVSRERALKEGQLAQAQAVLHGNASASMLPEVLASPAITALQAQISILAGQEAELATVKGANNLRLVAVRADLEKLHSRLQQETANVVGSLSAAVQAARAQEQSLREQMERLRGAVSIENSAQVGLRGLQTQARTTRSIYDSFLSRETELSNVAGIQEPDASLVSGARPPLGPSSPQSMRLLAVSALLSLVAGVVLACGIERLRSGFSLPEQLEAALGLPVIGVVPKVSRAVLRGRGTHGSIIINGALDRLRGRMRALGEHRPKVVMITSALPQEGKSIFAAWLARNAAAAGWRVLLLECDFGRPSLAQRFAVRSAPGLCEVLRGDLLGNDDAVLHQPQPGLHMITSGRVVGDRQELLASRQFGALLASCRKQYDLVVLDTPPVLPVADALVIAKLADTTIMAVRWEKTKRTAAYDAVRLLRFSGANVMGVVMTRVDYRTAKKAGGRLTYALANYDAYGQLPPSRI